MHRRLWGLALTGLALAACGGDSTGPTRIAVAGAWSGPVSGNAATGTLAFTLTETAGTVTGAGTLATASDAVALQITGTYSPPSVALTLTTPGFDPLNLSATVGETSMSGTLKALRDAGTTALASVAAVARIVAAVDRAIAGLGTAATDGDRALALEVKRRAAHYRSDKKLADADVVAAGGNAGRAERLRAEAGVMLQQDLARSGLGP